METSEVSRTMDAINVHFYGCFCLKIQLISLLDLKQKLFVRGLKCVKPFIRRSPSMAAWSTEINSKFRTFVSQMCCNWNKNLFPFVYNITLVGWWRGGLSASLAQSAGKSKGCSSKNINYPNFQKSQKTNFFQRIMKENQVSFTNFCLLSIKLRGIRCSRSCR